MPHRGGLILAGLICFCAGGLYGWSAIIGVLQSAFAISTADAGFAFSIAVVTFTIAVLATLKMPQASRRPKSLPALGLIAAISIGASVVAPNFLSFVIFFSICFGAASGAIYMVALNMAAVSDRPSVFTPVMVAAFGLGGAVFGPLWRLLAEAGWGLSSLLILSIALGTVSLIGFIAPAPQNGHMLVANPPPDAPTVTKPYQIVLVWMLFAFGSAGGLMVIGMASKIVEVAGSGVALSSAMLAGIAIGNTSGRLSVAGFNQVFDPISVAIIAAIIGGIGLIVANTADNPALIALAFILVALGYGMTASAVPSITVALFGRGNFNRIFPIVFTAWGVAGLSAPWIAGAIFDRMGSFSGAILAAFAATVLAGAIALLLRWTNA